MEIEINLLGSPKDGICATIACKDREMMITCQRRVPTYHTFGHWPGHVDVVATAVGD